MDPLMALFGFYGIFTNASTRTQVFGPDGWSFVELVMVPDYEPNYDFGVARIIEHKGGLLPLHICDLDPLAEEFADQVEGVSRGMYFRSNAELVFRDKWPGTEAPIDPSDITIYMLSEGRQIV